MTGLCECGCGSPAPIAEVTWRAKGWVKGRPKRFIRGHSSRLQCPGYSLEDRGHDTPCWIWQGAINPDNGYANGSAHRKFYERYVGLIPEGLQLDHLCRVPTCVNPNHLEPVTPAENTWRGNTAKLTREQVALIRASTGSRAALAERFGVTPGTIKCVVNGKSWRGIAPAAVGLDLTEEWPCVVCGIPLVGCRRGTMFCGKNCNERARRERRNPDLAPYRKAAK